MKHIEELSHTADLGFRVRARSLPGLFYWAGRALLFAMFESLDAPPRASRTLRLSADDVETLLVRFLNELIFLVLTREEVPVGMRVRVHPGDQGCALSAQVAWVPFSEVADRFLGEVKSATFHGLKIEKTDTGYEAQVVLDV